MGTQRDSNINLSSVAGMLRMIYNETLTTNELLGDINQSISGSKVVGSVTDMVSNEHQIIAIKNQSNVISYLKTISVTGQSILETLQAEFAQRRLSPETNQQTNENRSFATALGNHLNSMFNQQSLMDIYSLSLEMMLTMLGRINNTLNVIAASVQNIFDYLPSLLSKSNRSSEERTEKEFSSFAESFKEIKGVLTVKFVGLFEKFLTLYKDFINDQNTSRLSATAIQLNLFALSLRGLGHWLTQTKILFFGVVNALFVLTIFLISPLFALGIGLLVGAIMLLKNAMGGKGGENNPINLMITRANTLSIALVKMAAAMFLISRVPFGAVVKFSAMITMIALALKFFQKDQPNQSVIVKKSFKVSGAFSIAAGIFVLVLAMHAIGDVDFARASLILGFLGTLAITIRMFQTGRSGRNDIGTTFMKLSFGIGLLLIAIDAIKEVDWKYTAILFGFIAGLALVVAFANRISGDKNKTINIKKQTSFRVGGIFGFAMGVALLVLTIDAVTELDWAAAGKMILFIFSIGMAVAIPAFINRGGKNNLTSFAFGIAILVLTVAATEELNWSPAFNLLLFIVGIGISLGFFRLAVGDTSKLKMDAKNVAISLVSIAGGLFTFGLATRALLSEKVVIGMGTIATYILIAGVLSQFRTHVLRSVPLMKALSLSMLIAAGAVWVITATPIHWEAVGQFLSTVVAMGAVAIGISLSASVGLINPLGLLALVTLSTSMLISAIALKNISALEISFDTIFKFFGAVTAMGVLAVGISLISIPVAIGSAAMLVLGTSTLITAGAFYLITQLEFERRNIDDYIYAVKTLAMGYSEIGFAIMSATLVSVGVLVIATTTIVTSIAFTLISMFTFKPETFMRFNMSLKLLMGAYDKISIFQVGKTAIKSLGLLPILASSFMTAVVFKKISEVNIDRNAMTKYGAVLESFLDVTTTSINNSMDALKAAEPGLEAFGKLVSSCSSLVDVVEAFANMKIGVWEYNKQTGKMEIKSYKKLDDNMMASVGTGIGKIIKSLLGPMSVLASDDKQWRLGNEIIDNPFIRSNKISQFFLGDNDSGKNRIQMIGDAYSSLSTVMSNIVGLEMLSDENRFRTFKQSFAELIAVIVNAAQQLEPMNHSQIKTTGISLMVFAESVKRFVESSENNTKNISIDNLLQTLSDDKRWNKINKYLKVATDNVKQLVSNVNKLDVTKATALERNLKLLADTNTLEGIRNVIEELTEMIGLLNENQERSQRVQMQSVNTLGVIAQNTTGLVSPPNQQQQNTQTGSNSIIPKKTEEQKRKEELDLIVETLNRSLEGINTKLGSVLKVQVVNQNNVNVLT